MIVAEYRYWKEIILASCIQTLRSMNYFNLAIGEITRAVVSEFIGEGEALCSAVLLLFLQG